MLLRLRLKLKTFIPILNLKLARKTTLLVNAFQPSREMPQNRVPKSEETLTKTTYKVHDVICGGTPPK